MKLSKQNSHTYKIGSLFTDCSHYWTSDLIGKLEESRASNSMRTPNWPNRLFDLVWSLNGEEKDKKTLKEEERRKIHNFTRTSMTFWVSKMGLWNFFVQIDQCYPLVYLCFKKSITNITCLQNYCTKVVTTDLHQNIKILILWKHWCMFLSELLKKFKKQIYICDILLLIFYHFMEFFTI